MESINGWDFIEKFKELGVITEQMTVTNIHSIRFEPTQIVVSSFKVNENGHKYKDPDTDDVAMEHVSYFVRWPRANQEG